MKRSTDRILTTHTGSLPRPKEVERLISLADARELSAADAEALPGAVRAAVAEVVGSQVKQRVDAVDHDAGKVDALGLIEQTRRPICCSQSSWCAAVGLLLHGGG